MGRADDAGGGLSGNFTLTDGTVVTFSEIENIICFTPGARILTPQGERAIETLKVGDLVVTRDNGPQLIRWIGRRTVEGRGISAIRELETARESGAYALRLRVSDAEGNVGAPSTVPLSYRCVRSDVGGQALSAVLPGGRARRVVRQGRGMALRGRLTGHRGVGVAGSPLCVFSRTLTDAEPEFLGLALSGDDGRYRFPVPAGPSRELTVAHRTGHREIASSVRLLTRVRPSFRVRRRVVRNKRFARFRACVPGPRRAGVLLTLQVKRGEGWLAFRRYRTRRNGCARIVYRFTRTDRPTLYLMRAEVRKQGGFPYETGISRPLRLVVVPARAGG